jgi:transcriptional regulator with XRE-family HTH domain
MDRKVTVETTEYERPAATSAASSKDRGRPLADLLEEFEASHPEEVAASGLSSAAMRAGDLIRSMRKAAGLSQSQLAREIGVAQSRVSEIESGSGTQGPTWDLIERVTAACGKSIMLVDNPSRPYQSGPDWDWRWVCPPPRREVMPEWYSACETFLETSVTQIANAGACADYAQQAYETLTDPSASTSTVHLNEIRGHVYVSVDLHKSRSTPDGLKVLMAPVAICRR